MAKLVIDKNKLRQELSDMEFFGYSEWRDRASIFE